MATAMKLQVNWSKIKNTADIVEILKLIPINIIVPDGQTMPTEIQRLISANKLMINNVKKIK
ncbi:MAG: hypothetical protein PHX51_08550 [Clostridia bacterium]|nr:hypothetical protein [Clostridia bacterium]